MKRTLLQVISGALIALFTVCALAAPSTHPVLLRFGKSDPRSVTLKAARTLSGTKKSFAAKAEAFANDEMRVRVQRNVTGRPVWIAQARQKGRDASATSLFQVLQAVEASHSNFASGVNVVLDDRMRERYGAAFLNEMFGAFDVGKVHFAGADGHAKEAPAEPIAKILPAEGGSSTVVWTGSSHPELAASVAKKLHLPEKGIVIDGTGDLSKTALPSNPAGKRVVLVQTKRIGGGPERLHEDMLEMLHAAWQAKRAGATEVTLISPYLPYSRSDRKDTPGTMVGAAVLPQLMKRAGIGNVVFYSVHQAQEVGIFQALRMRVVHAAGEVVLANRIGEQLLAKGIDPDTVRVVAPDAGAGKRAKLFARLLAKKLGIEPSKLADQVLIGNKERHGTEIKLRFDGDVEGKTVITIDDETASGGTMADIANAASEKGAAQVIGAVSHLTGKAQTKIAASKLSKLYVLDTLPQAKDVSDGGHVEVVPIADHLAEVLRAMHSGAKADELLFYEHQ